jgi:hypothetical protein
MELHAPAMWVFVLSLLIAALAVVATFVHINYVSPYAFWIAILGYVVLALGNLVKTSPSFMSSRA